MITGDLIKIDGQTVPSCKSYEITYEKVWKDRSTNMAGDVRATLLGTNVILEVEFGGELLQADMANLLPKLKQDYFGVTYYDPETNTTKTAQYYVEDYTVAILSKQRGQFDTVEVEFLPVARS